MAGVILVSEIVTSGENIGNTSREDGRMFLGGGNNVVLFLNPIVEKKCLSRSDIYWKKQYKKST